MNVHVFIGPTLPARTVRGILPMAVMHPPVAHGDLLAMQAAADDVIVLVDGYYHHSAPVRHKEILALLADGIPVIGCASMGALRAAELARYGMVGTGEVFRLYRDGIIEADDEVALAHSPDADYRPFTVPLVTIRHAAISAVSANALSEPEADAIVTLAQRIHYTDRTWGALRAAGPSAAVERLHAFVRRHGDVKAQDTIQTLHAIVDGELPPAGDPGQALGGHEWHNRHFAEWQTEFATTEVETVPVSDSAVIRYQQLYRADFPQRWQRFALDRIGGPCADAATTAVHYGLRPRHKAEYWLTEDETDRLSDRDALERTLVRSHQPLCPTRDLADADPELCADAEARRTVAQAAQVNAEVAGWGSKHSIDHLKLDALIAHLAQVWQVQGEEELLAAARDRGFPTVAAAAESARPFFLYQRFFAKRRSA